MGREGELVKASISAQCVCVCVCGSVTFLTRSRASGVR